jgi:hypothetical protein
MPSGDDMDSSQDKSSQDTENAGEVMESLGVPTESSDEVKSHEDGGHEEENDPLYVQKRLKQQRRAHERETRELRSRIESLESASNPQQSNYQPSYPHDAGVQPGNMDENIHKAVSYALQQRDFGERKAREAEHMAHVQGQYDEFKNHLDDMEDKYKDFKTAVTDPKNTNFTPHMRDAALLLGFENNNPGNAGEVLYKLGKNPEELQRISKLHPLEQAREMVKLSKALISGGDNKISSPRPLGQIKNTPVTNSHAVNDKTPISSLRQRMKSGNWK